MSTNYTPRSAWIRATLYFTACFVIAHFSGALQMVMNNPLATMASLQDFKWLLFTLLCVAVEVWAYIFLWPRGTLTHGRHLYWSVVLTFGVVWGLSEGLLFLSVFVVASKFMASKFLVWLVSFLVIGTFVGLWHHFYWDMYVAPEHNIIEWNMKKVLYGHAPNIMITLAYLTIYESAGVFVLCQAFALIASTHFMRFPPFWAE